MKRSALYTLAALAVLGLLIAVTVRAPTGGREDPLPSYSFAVEIDGIVQGSFRSVSGLSCETEVIEYREGGDNTIRLLPGLTRCGPVELKYGLTTNRELWDWYQSVMDGGKEIRKNISIVILTPAHEERARYNLYNAWPTKWEGPALNASGNDVAVETIELAVERIERA